MAKKKATGNPPQGQVGRLSLTSTFSLAGKTIQYNPSKISLQTYDEMRQYHTVKSALEVAKKPVQAVDWWIKSEVPEHAKLVEANLRGLFTELIKDLLLSFDFGFAAFEKVWEMKDGYWQYKKFMPISAFETTIQIEPDGTFNGIKQMPTSVSNQLTGVSQNTANPYDISIPADKSFVFTYQKEFGNYYGIPRSRGAYTAWYVIRHMLEFTAKFYEKYGSPQLIGYAPVGKSKFSGREVDNLDWMVKFLESLQNSSVGALPKSGKTRDEMDYFIDILESKRTGGDYISILKYLDTCIFMGCLVPPLTYSSGEKGSYALFEEQASIFAQGIDAEITMIKRYIDVYIIDPIISYNFGPEWVGKTQWEYSPISKKDKELLRQILLALVQRGEIDLAVKYVAEQLGVPTLEAGETLESIKKDEADQIAEVPVAKVSESVGPVKAERILASRKPNAIEKHINFEKIKQMFDKNEKTIVEQSKTILNKQKDALINDVTKAIRDGKYNNIQNMDLRYQGEYSKFIVDQSRGIFEEGFADVKDEMGTDVSISNEAKQQVNARGKVIAEKHMSDLKFAVLMGALAGISKDLSEKDILFNIGKKWDDYVGSSLENSAIMLTQKMYADGREWSAEEAGIEYAEWSAVLDDKVCDFCASRDGMIISTSDPDFTEFSPGEVHENCRCIWVFLDGLPEGETVDWKTPSTTAQNEYYQMGRKVCHTI